MEMEYRRLGHTGLKVSVLSFGSWVTFGPQLAGNLAEDCLAAAYDAGVNFFDNAEAYVGGESERIMGEAIASLGWPRHELRDLHQALLGPPRRTSTCATPSTASTCSRPSTDRWSGSGLDFVDLRLLPPPRPRDARSRRRCGPCPTSITAGKALYWGTSEWSAEQFREAWDIAERHHLHKPVVEQPQYNLLVAGPGGAGVRPALRRHRPGPHHLEPAGSGLLTGKYLDGVPEGSRATLPGLRVAAPTC